MPSRKSMPNQRKIEESRHAILACTQLLSLATVNDDGTPHINTAFFAYRDHDLFFLSDVRSQHCRNLQKRPPVSVAIFDSRQKWNDDKVGIQIFGRAEACDVKASEVAQKEYASRYRAYRSYLRSLKGPPDPSFKFFVIHSEEFVLLDERRFGEEVYVRSGNH